MRPTRRDRIRGMARSSSARGIRASRCAQCTQSARLRATAASQNRGRGAILGRTLSAHRAAVDAGVWMIGKGARRQWRILRRSGGRRRGWIWGVGAAVAVQLCVCVVCAALAPVALLRFQGKPGSARSGLASALICPGAKASDATPERRDGAIHGAAGLRRGAEVRQRRRRPAHEPAGASLGCGCAGPVPADGRHLH